METSLPGASPLQALSADLAGIVERVGRSVVAVHGRRRLPSSGVVWRRGIVVTAAHTLRRDEGISVTVADGRSVAAVLAGRDAGTDIAVLKLDGTDLEPAETGDAGALKVGHFVLAVARADGLHTSADSGLVGGVGGPWRTWRGGQIDALVRLDGGLQPGFSGAALSDAGGKVVGICTSALSRGPGIVIPATTIARVADELLAKGHVSRGYLGIATQQVSLADALVAKLCLSSNLGLLVVSVAPGGPADLAGLMIGDVLVGLADQPTRDMSDVHAVLGAERIGQPLKAAVIRGGEPKACTITVGERAQRHQCG